jgi:hypothetical protein
MKMICLVAALLAALALAGCGDSEGDASRGAGTGPGISIEEAIAADTDEMLLVNGNLLADGDQVRLCHALAESFPPQCGGPSLLVEGIKLEDVDGLITEGAVSWTDRPIQLPGIVENETLMVSETPAPT